MAQILIHTFTSGGFTYDVYFDDVTFATYAETDDPAPPREVPEGDLGAPVGTSVYDYCIGTTLVDLRLRTLYPFVGEDLTINSTVCGYTPPPCTLAFTVTPTNETAAGKQDGTVLMNVTAGAGGYSYSLDGVEFTPLKTFFKDLPPGSYTAHVKDASGCIATQPFTIAAGAATPNPVYPWAQRPQHWFRLNGQKISEPIKWDSINVVGKRDKVYHGWNYQFTDEVVDLEFDDEAGFDIIRSAYRANGSDGEVILEYGYREGGVSYTLFEGRLNLNTYKEYPSKIACSVDRRDGNNLLESRVDTKISMGSDRTIGGQNIDPPAPLAFTLHGKEIKKVFKMDRTQELSGPAYAGQGGILYTLPETLDAKLAEIEDTFTYERFTGNVSPVTDNKYLFDVKFAGLFEFKIILTFKIAYYRSSVNAPTSGTSQVILNVNGTETVLATVTSPVVIPAAQFTLSANTTFLRQLIPPDKVYLYVKHTFNNNNQVGIYTWEQLNQVEITALERAADTPCKGWWVYDALDHTIKSCTDNLSKLKSSLFRRWPLMGSAGKTIITNGFQVRKYEVDQRPLKVSLKTQLESLNAIYCIGVQYDDEAVVIEPMEHFYQDRQIHFIEQVTDLSKEAAKELLYNEVDIGYDTFQEDGYNTLDEFNTRHEYATPIESNRVKLSQRSKFIASGYSIETSRRQQFEETASNSFQNDENPFVLVMDVQDGQYKPERNQNFDEVVNMISPETAYNLRISPKRMLLRWAAWLRNSLFFKSPTAEIRNTFTVQNGSLRTRLGATDPLIEEGADVVLSDYGSADLFVPEWVKFSCSMTPDIVNMINLAMKGKWGADKDYGYIVYNDPLDGFVQGWLYQLDYNFYEEKATLTLLRKP